MSYALVVEDNVVSRDALVSVFQLRGIATKTAGTLAEAMRKLDDGPTLVMLDLSLPDGSGVELLRRVRQHKLDIPIAVTTGTCDMRLLREVRRLEPDKLLLKPYGLSELVGWLKDAKLLCESTSPAAHSACK